MVVPPLDVLMYAGSEKTYPLYRSTIVIFLNLAVPLVYVSMAASCSRSCALALTGALTLWVGLCLGFCCSKKSFTGFEFSRVLKTQEESPGMLPDGEMLMVVGEVGRGTHHFLPCI